jgi:rhomboid protease GluP
MGSNPPVVQSHGQTTVHGTPGAEPELLPPDRGYIPPPAARRPRRSWQYAPVTYLLLGINCAVFLAMLARGVSLGSPTVDQLMAWGADRPDNILMYGEWWRIVTAMFVHVGLIHIATNMWCLWNLGLLAEPLMGSAGLFAAYILTGAAGNLLSTWHGWVWPAHDPSGLPFFQAGAGASGAVFGIAGALIVLLKSNRLPIPPQEVKKLRKSVIYFAAINLIIGLSVNFGSGLTGISIDNSAHLGGFACGLLLAVPMVPRIGSSRDTFQTRLRAAIILIVGLLVLFGFYIAHVPPPPQI